jgi:lipopolysaccharide/colanic/teichoic acid biosynthesis glycosyltransferase
MNKYLNEYYDISGKKHIRKTLNKISVITYSLIKFILDRLIAILSIIILMPLLMIIGLTIKITSKGPIIYKQKRTGKKGKTITIYKFRTMKQENNVNDLTKTDQITKIGVLLRIANLDEIPQLFNILKGEMSFIGPRPWIPEYYKNMNNIQKHKYDITPGLTGLAQVSGKNQINVSKKIEYDLLYIKNYSLIQDIKILFLTIKTLLKNTDYKNGKQTIKEELEELRQSKKED